MQEAEEVKKETNSLDDDGVVVEGELEGEEEETEPEYEYGIIIHANREGKGIEMNSFSENCVRVATPDDYVSLVSAAFMHILTNLGTVKVANMMSQMAQQKRTIVKPNIHVRGR